MAGGERNGNVAVLNIEAGTFKDGFCKRRNGAISV